MFISSIFLSPGMEPWQNAKGHMSEEEMQACHLAKLSPGPFFFQGFSHGFNIMIHQPGV